MYNTILVAVDFSSGPDAVVQKAVDVAKGCDAAVHLVHVVEDHSHVYDILMMPPEMGFDTLEIRKKHMASLVELAAQFDIPPDCCHIEQASTGAGIVTAAKRVDADLVVAGTHGRHGISLLLMGSTADNLLHHSDIDLLAVRVS